MAKTKAITAVQDWKNRMKSAKSDLNGIGQQRVIEKVIELDPELDSLANANRWRNAWFIKVSDPHITLLVEQAAKFFMAKSLETSKRLSRQKLKKVQ